MLKPLYEITAPDSRYADLMVPDGAGWFRPMTLADHHASIAAVTIPENVPDEVQVIFDRARHAFLYGWFDYELTPVAEMQALAALETALRDIMRHETPPKGKRWMLGDLMNRAVADGLLPPTIGAVPLPLAIRELRNHWAHGSANFGAPAMALNVIDVCADLIGRLYSTKVRSV